MSAPNKPRLRYHELLAWMESEGIPRLVVLQMIKIGMIRGRPLIAGKRKFYYPNEIQPILDEHSHNGVSQISELTKKA